MDYTTAINKHLAQFFPSPPDDLVRMFLGVATSQACMPPICVVGSISIGCVLPAMIP